MEELLSIQVWLGAGLIFVLRLVNMAVDTIRVMMVMRGRRFFVWILGFVQTVIHIFVLTRVIQDLTNLPNLLAYAGGFATGNVVGMWVEGKLAIGHAQLQVISPKLGPAVVERLRAEGFAVTEVAGRGKDGMVSVIYANVMRKDIEHVQALIEDVDEHSVVTVESLRPLRRGFWGR